MIVNVSQGLSDSVFLSLYIRSSPVADLNISRWRPFSRVRDPSQDKSWILPLSPLILVGYVCFREERVYLGDDVIMLQVNDGSVMPVVALATTMWSPGVSIFHLESG